MATTPYLTVREVSGELGISTSGVYKLIGRGKLPAIKRSERGTLVPRPAFDAYKRRLAGERPPPPPSPMLAGPADVEALASEFERESSHTPTDWIDAWKADELEDSAENMVQTIRALGILHARLDSGSADSDEAGRLAALPAKARSPALKPPPAVERLVDGGYLVDGELVGDGQHRRGSSDWRDVGGPVGPIRYGPPGRVLSVS